MNNVYPINSKMTTNVLENLEDDPGYVNAMQKTYLDSAVQELVGYLRDEGYDPDLGVVARFAELFQVPNSPTNVVRWQVQFPRDPRPGDIGTTGGNDRPPLIRVDPDVYRLAGLDLQSGEWVYRLREED